MLHYVARRLVAAVPTLLGVSLVVFMMVRLLPGDPARIGAGLLASESDVEHIRHQLGLDQPGAVQYAAFLGRLVHFDLGNDGPLPGRSEEWSIVTGYRVRLALEARQWEVAECLQRILVDWDRQRAAAALSAPPQPERRLDIQSRCRRSPYKWSSRDRPA